MLKKVSNGSQMAQLWTLYAFHQVTHVLKDSHNLGPVGVDVENFRVRHRDILLNISCTLPALKQLNVANKKRCSKKLRIIFTVDYNTHRV
jgi:hypothetical protein